jgi:molybdate transport system substrate-binding protein
MVISLFCAVIIRDAVAGLIEQYEAETGHVIKAKYDLNPLVKKRIDGGESFDVVIINPEMVDDLISQGRVLAGSRADIGCVDMGMAVNQKTDVSSFDTIDQFKSFLLSVSSIAYSSEGTSGKTFLATLKKIDLLEELADRLKPVGEGQSGKQVANGDVATAALPKSIIMASSDLRLAGTFPSDLQTRIYLAAGIRSDAKNLNAAEELVAFLSGKDTDETFTLKGIDRTRNYLEIKNL